MIFEQRRQLVNLKKKQWDVCNQHMKVSRPGCLSWLHLSPAWSRQGTQSSKVPCPSLRGEGLGLILRGSCPDQGCLCHHGTYQKSHSEPLHPLTESENHSVLSVGEPRAPRQGASVMQGVGAQLKTSAGEARTVTFKEIVLCTQGYARIRCGPVCRQQSEQKSLFRVLEVLQ